MANNVSPLSVPEIDPAALYAPAHVGRLISWRQESVRRAVHEGRLPAVFVGRNVRIPGVAVLRVLKEGMPRRAA